MSVCGTPEYLAPEVIKKQGHNKAVDWWCLGCIIYEMVTGFPPFRSQNRMELFESILYQPLQVPNVTKTLGRPLRNYKISWCVYSKKIRRTDSEPPAQKKSRIILGLRRWIGTRWCPDRSRPPSCPSSPQMPIFPTSTKNSPIVRSNLTTRTTTSTRKAKTLQASNSHPADADFNSDCHLSSPHH